MRAVQAIERGHNVLVGAPTGAGKTLVAEYAIEDALRRGRRCIYTSPIKALSNQKFRDFRDQPGSSIGIQTGDVTLFAQAQVLIMTTEILRNVVLEDPRSLSDVEYVVFDEIHFLDDPERGTVWEEALIFCPPNVRFICLSATVSNLDQLGRWLRSIRTQELEVIYSERRPVPLYHELIVPGVGRFPSTKLAQLHKQLNSRASASGGGERGRHSSPGKKPRGRGARRPREGGAIAMRALLDSLEENGSLPALVFAFSRRECEHLAEKNVFRELLSAEESLRMQALQHDLARQFQLPLGALDQDPFRCARHGLAYHHAGMLPIDKELVERMFTSGLLKMLFATETFALGINMPARSVVFASLKKFDGVSLVHLGAREYMQMAGRAGRQGLDKEGLVYSLVDAEDARTAPLVRILSGQPEPVRSRFRLSYSSLLHLVARLGRERVYEAWSRSLHSFQRADKGGDAQQREALRQRELLDGRLAFLEELGYLETKERLSPKGQIARRINGCEIQLTELIFLGPLENRPPRELACVFVALAFEDRRRPGDRQGAGRDLASLRRSIDRALASLIAVEARHGIQPPLRPADWGLTELTLAFCDGGDLVELAENVDLSPGDVVRTFRLAIQLMRQVRLAIDPAWDLAWALERAQGLLDRDEVDARRQLELG